MGIPVVIAENGQGLPVKPVEDNAPVMTVAENGLGAPIVISELGAPFIVEGIAPPVEWDWQMFSMTNGGDGVQWVGYSVGGATLPNPAFGSISNEPTDKATLLAFYQDTASGVVLAVFSGEWEAELAGLEVSLGGLVLEPFEIEIIDGNTWLRYGGMPGLWTEGVVYEVLFGWGLQPVFDPASEALFARFTTPPTDGRKWLINNLIVSLKDAGVWSKLDALYITAAADSQAARQNWIDDAFNLTPVSAPTFTADRGYQGDGSASYLQPSFNPSAAAGKYGLNSATLGVWALTANNATYTDIGAGDGTNFAVIRPRDGGLLRAFTNSGAAGGSDATVATSAGLSAWSRTGPSAITLYKNGTSIVSDAKASSAMPNANITLLGRSGTVQLSQNQVAAGFIGSQLSAAEHSSAFNSINTYLQAVGAE